MENSIYALIPKVMADVGSVTKDRKNQHQGYTFRGIEDMYLAVHPAMVKHGIFCAPSVEERTEYRYEKANFEGKTAAWLHVVLKVRHRFYAADGSYVDVVTCGEGLDNSDKSTNKAMSGAMKYALIELFCVPTQDIEDSDRTTPETGVKKATVIERPVSLPARDGGSSSAELGLQRREAAVSPLPAAAPEPVKKIEYIDATQAGKIAQRFRESLKPELQSEAELYRHDALFYLGYIDKDANPSSLMIPAKDYATAGKKLIEYAKNLK